MDLLPRRWWPERQAEPADDLISALLAVDEAGDRLTENELISTTILLFAAGIETTTNLIGNGLGALFATPTSRPGCGPTRRS